MALSATLASSCQCSPVTPLAGLFDVSSLRSAPCLKTALNFKDKEDPGFPRDSCLDLSTFGMGCGPHWKSIFSENTQDRWVQEPWCFLEDTNSCHESDTLEIEVTTNNVAVKASISYRACGRDEGTASQRKSLRGNNANSNSFSTRHMQNMDSAQTLGWEFAGPTTYISKFGEGPKLASAGAVQNVAEGTTGTWFIGSVNGGVWRTRSLDQEKPHWVNVLDGQPVTCSSMSALHVSDTNPNRVYAGCGGSTSSEQGSDHNVVNSGDWAGIMTSADGGDTWQMMEAFPVNFYVTDILEIKFKDETIILVSAQSSLYDPNLGGIWRSTDGGESFDKVDRNPTFTLRKYFAEGKGPYVAATHARDSYHSISFSFDGGASFDDLGKHLDWGHGAEPFYTCFTVLRNGQWILAGLTRLGPFPNNTDSRVFVSDKSGGAFNVLQQPMRMDQDSMPKDRMAVLADPVLGDLFYVAGNAEALAWRVNATSGVWTKLWDKPDVLDGSIPHGDCRNFAWDPAQDRLLLVSDGGIFAREKPREAGGRWVALNGDYSSLELLSAHYDPRNDRYVMGAQDNCAIVTKMNSKASDVGIGFVEGDGAITLVDSSAEPSRLFGTTQFLGVGTVEEDPETLHDGDDNDGDDDDDDDDGCGGLCFVQGDNFIEVEVDKYFPEPSSFPFFVQPYTLNRLDPTLLHIWTNGTGPERPSAFYQFSIPHSVQDKDDIEAPSKLLETPPGVMIMDFVSGGYSQGKAYPELILGISTTNFYVRALAEDVLIERSLPMKFADPVTLDYDYSQGGTRILGPLTHARTVSMTVSSSDWHVIAVTGWSNISSNLADEAVFLTTDAGRTWRDVTCNLKDASGVCGKVRPGGVHLVDLDEKTRALLVGTSNGILVTFVTENHPTQQKWVRLGTSNEFPIVLVADVDYERSSDRLVAATFGRGIYVLKDAKQKLLDVRDSLIDDGDEVE